MGKSFRKLLTYLVFLGITWTMSPVHAQVVTSVPGNLFSTELPDERFKPICDAAIATAKDDTLTAEARRERLIREGAQPLLVYDDGNFLVQLMSPDGAVYLSCYSETLRLQQTGLTNFGPRHHGDVTLYVTTRQRKLANSPEVEAHLQFLDAQGQVIRDFKRTGYDTYGELTRDEEGNVTAWQAGMILSFTHAYRYIDEYAAEFSRASTLRLVFKMDGVTHTADLKVDRSS